jgi:hypothetical protein
MPSTAEPNPGVLLVAEQAAKRALTQSDEPGSLLAASLAEVIQGRQARGTGAAIPLSTSAVAVAEALRSHVATASSWGPAGSGSTEQSALSTPRQHAITPRDFSTPRNARASPGRFSTGQSTAQGGADSASPQIQMPAALDPTGGSTPLASSGVYTGLESLKDSPAASAVPSASALSRRRGDSSCSWAFWKPQLIYSYDSAVQAAKERAAAAAAAAETSGAMSDGAGAAESGADISMPGSAGGGGAAGRAQTARGSGSYRSVQGSVGSDEEALVFDSLFECGNLDTAHRIGATEYELQLRTDNKTTGHTQWYFFAVSNAHSGATYRFHISNLNKPDSLYARGQQPLFFSTVASQQSGLGWHRIGQAISYRKNGKKRNGRPLFTLTVSPPPSTKWTRRVPHLVLIGHAASLTPY